MLGFFKLMIKFVFDIMSIKMTIFDTTFSFFQLFLATSLLYFVFYIFYSVTD